MTESIQAHLFQTIKERLGPNMSMVDEVADTLEISNDSTYRRIRGETALSLDEASKLCKAHDISLDSILQAGTNEITFHFEPLHEDSFTFMDYLGSILSSMELIDSAEEKEVIYMANEIPLFHLLNSPALAAFKLFFWQKTILDFSTFRNMKFKLFQKDEQVNDISRKLRALYCKTPSVEVYNSETIDTTLKQIEYYYETGYFESSKDAITLLDQLSQLVDHIKLQCENGFKFNYDADGEVPEYVPYHKEGNYTVYHNEVLHSDNHILVRMGDQHLTFLTSNGVNVLYTKSSYFHDEAYRVIDNLKKKSTLISGTSEKERNKVFLNYHKKIEALKSKLE